MVFNLRGVFIGELLVSDVLLKAITYKNVFVRSLSVATIHGCQIFLLKFEDMFQ